MIGVQNLIKKHQALIAEINNHEPQIDHVVRNAEQMTDQGEFHRFFCIFSGSVYFCWKMMIKRISVSRPLKNSDAFVY